MLEKNNNNSDPLKYSVVVPIYNTEQYLDRCLESIARQKYPNIEIVLVNDGSTDNSLEKCSEWEKKDNRIIVVNQVNQGLSEARNTGLKSASGEYVLFLDSDDWWKEDFLRSATGLIEKSDQKYDIIIGAAEKVDSDTGEHTYIGSHFEENAINGKEGCVVLKYILQCEPKREWYVWRGVYRREYLIDNNLFFRKGIFYEDVDWLPRVIYSAKTVGYIDKVFVQYAFHRPNSILNTINKRKTADKIFVASKVFAFADETADSGLSLMLKKNFSDLFLSGFGDYINGCTDVEIQIKDNIDLMKFSNNRFGVLSYRLIKLFGFTLGVRLIRIIIKCKGVIV